MPTVDVCIPCYNYGRFLEPCVGSVLSQEDCEVRLLIIDNASTDNSAEILTKIASEDGRVEVRVHQSNHGHIASFNEGVEWASSDYFMLLNADDMLAPQCLARAASLMDTYPDISFTHGREIILHTSDTLPPLDRTNRSSWEISLGLTFIENICRTGLNPVGGSTVIVRTNAQKEAGCYRAELPHTADLEMWLRLATRGCVAHTNTVQGIRRIHDANMSTPYFSQKYRDFLEREAAFERFFALEGRSISGSQRLRRMVRRNLSEAAYWCSLRQLQSGNTSGAWKLMRLSLRLARRNAIIPPVGHLWRMWAKSASPFQLAEWNSSDGTYIRAEHTV
jgi:glycosyltransferase involved in cell wall biosynthesis